MTVAPAIALDRNLWIGISGSGSLDRKDLQQFQVTGISDRGEAFAQGNEGEAAGILPQMLRPYELHLG